jgi:type I restriction-modification system DNA methylase subunit
LVLTELFSEKIPENIYFKDLREKSFFKSILLGSKLKERSRLNEKTRESVNQFRENLNPIIVNLLVMASFDFRTELRVNILGHIFEHSIVDLEELKMGEVSRRKKEGIFYTPDFITEYICRSSIIGYLSKKGHSLVNDLLDEYQDNLGELEQKLTDLKILDPACGSGAFLLKAVDILLEIFKEICDFKEIKGYYIANSASFNQITLGKWQDEAIAAEIIEKNIFGVDVNEESVEITKLGLFLRISTKNRSLINLSNNIIHGNSLIDDPQVAGDTAFDWNVKFREIIEKGGFDIIIGNPPYIRSGLITSVKSYLKEKYEDVYSGNADLYVYFFQKGISLLKNNGIFSSLLRLCMRRN